MRARDLGIEIGSGALGPNNAITDIPGIRVGHTTLVRGEGPLVPGEGPVRTGVTLVIPDEDVWRRPVFAGIHRLNGNGEVTGLEWLRESGMLTSPVGVTSTGSVGVVRDSLLALEARVHGGVDGWSLPVVGETWDGRLNDLLGGHVKPEHVDQAFQAATSGAVPEGNVGGGTGMICHGFKGGIGTASRSVAIDGRKFTLGVLVQANHGRRERLRVNGIAVGKKIPASEVPVPRDVSGRPAQSGSIVAVIATDAPLLPHQCARLAQRSGLGVGRMGGTGEQWSGDFFLAFSTGNRGALPSHLMDADPVVRDMTMLSDGCIDTLFDAVIDATEESIINALVAAETMTGRDGVVAHAIPHDRLVELVASAS